MQVACVRPLGRLAADARGDLGPGDGAEADDREADREQTDVQHVRRDVRHGSLLFARLTGPHEGVEDMGFEPTTPGLQSPCSTN